jgi:CHAD domain-containing protein
MHLQLQQITDELESASRALATGYDPEQLYILRVRIRRIRSILKHAEGHRARSFRKSWGGFAAVTNDARDWDVFLSTAETLISARDLRTFVRINAQRADAARESVMDMISSSTWRRQLTDWRDFLVRSVQHIPGHEQLESALERTLEKARRTLERALTMEDDRSWHKLRIAVKEIRYVADTGASQPESGDYFAGIAATCRALQTLLGNWHDTVVQLDILDRLEAVPVHSRLTAIVRERKDELLNEIHSELGNHPLFR